MSKELIERLRNTTYHNLDPYEAADRIEQLEAEVERLSSMCCCDPEFNLSMYAGGASAEGLYGTLTMQMQGVFVKYVREEQLAASQAREQQLREALDELVDLVQAIMEGEYKPDSFTCQPALQALALPQDTTALEAMIAKAGDVAAAKARQACIDLGAKGIDYFNYKSFVGAIDKLPSIKLEDIIK